MEIDDVESLFRKIKRHPAKTLALLLIVGAITVVQGVFFDSVKDAWTKWRNPFNNLEGEYRGTAESNTFRLCLVVQGDIVTGTMTWPDDPANHYYVNYDGKIDGQHVDLQWKRNPAHPIADAGNAVITPGKHGHFLGHWKSSMLGGEEAWDLVRSRDKCDVLEFHTTAGAT